jgi:threonine/homoserine efflux transporter RhtA
MSARTTSTLATLGLLAMTAVWGSTFVLIKDVVGRMPVADFLAVRFVIAAVVMLALFARPVLRLDRRQVLRGLLLGVIYGIGQLLQTWGLSLISPSVSGFATGMYVVFTPILALLLLRQHMAGVVWLAVALSTAGLALLSLNGVSIDLGVWLTLASAALYALHIVLLGQWSRQGEAFGLSAVQMVAIALVCLLATAPGTLAQVQPPYLPGNLPQEMQPDADPDQAGEPRPTRGRIELAKPAPHAPVFVPADKHRAMCTGAALAMQHPHVTGQQHPIAGIAHASAQVQILKVQKVRLVKTVHALEHGARQEHERAGHCLGSDDMIG